MTCVCVWIGWGGRCWGEWVTGLDLGFFGPGSGRVGWCYVCMCCESGLFVLMAGPGICILC